MYSVRQLADAILPSLKLNASLPTCLPLFHTLSLCFAHFCFLLAVSPPLLPSTYILSLSVVFQPVYTTFNWAPWFNITRFHCLSFSVSSLYVLAFLSSVYTYLPLCLYPLMQSSPPCLFGGKNRCSSIFLTDTVHRAGFFTSSVEICSLVEIKG